MGTSDSRLVRSLPLLIFAVFAIFWTGYDIALGLWLATLPSLGVLLVLVLHALRTGGEASE